VLGVVIVLVVTNLATLAVLLYLKYAPREAVPAEPAVEQALAAAAPPAPNRIRQLISVEVLNPVELASTRGRVLGIAGSFAPAFTRRLVYDQLAKTLRSELVERSVVAEVRVHTLRPAAANGAPSTASSTYVDELTGVEQPPHPSA
jgi:hypothetical protein